MPVNQMLVGWSGGSAGLPGVNVVYNDGTSNAAIAELLAFFVAIRSLLPTGITINVPSEGDTFDTASGAIIGGYSGASGGSTTGTGSADHAAGVGVALGLNTNGIANRRRIRGRMFLCPLTETAFDGDGTLTNTARTLLETSGNTMVSGGNFVVWSRPTSTTSGDGAANEVVSVTVPDRITALRSRRY